MVREEPALELHALSGLPDLSLQKWLEFASHAVAGNRNERWAATAIRWTDPSTELTS